MKKMLFLLCLALGGYAGVQAQSVKGRILDDSTGEGLAGVSVTVSGTSIGTTTGPDGFFSVFAPADGKTHHAASMSNAGYTTVTMPLKAAGRCAGNPAEKGEPKSLDDVVIIGYQTVKRRDLMASVSSVGAQDLKDIPLNSAPEALVGRLAGVQVTGVDGAPNAQVFITVRGGGSITQSNAPLYMVDGVQIDNALADFVSPQDIAVDRCAEDAAATSIYGARGSNGVVIITTKGGRNTSGKTTIAYNGFMRAFKGRCRRNSPVPAPLLTSLPLPSMRGLWN